MLGGERSASPPKVDFSYAFATPHRITIGRPDASDRTLLDAMPSYLQMSWSYDNLTMPTYPLLTFKHTDHALAISDYAAYRRPRVSQKPMDAVRGGPAGVGERLRRPQGTIKLEALGGMTAGLIRIEAVNTDSQPHQFRVHCGSYNSWGENPAWVDPTQAKGDNLVAGFNDRADRVLVMGIGADAYSLQSDGKAAEYNDMVLVWNLKPGEKRSGWIVRPYNAYAADLPELRKHDWAKEWEQGKKEWHDLLGRALKFSIPDAGRHQRLSLLRGRSVHHARADGRRLRRLRGRHRAIPRGQFDRSRLRDRGTGAQRISQGSGRWI